MLAKILRVACSILLLTLLPAEFFSSLPHAATEDLLEKSRAMYAALNSYSDTGIVTHDYGYTNSPAHDHHKFITSLKRSPRGFYFEFNKEGGDRYVIWGDPQAFHTWWKATGVESDYPNPDNAGAFTTSAVNTVGATGKIVSLLYKKGALPSDFAYFNDAVVEGKENISAHECYRLVGTAKDVYGTGHEVNVRKLSVWIDTDSLLIRKIVEEWKPLPGQVSRITTTFEPQANPALDESKFKFTLP